MVLISIDFIIFVKSLHSWLSHMFRWRGCLVAIRTSELNRWVSLCTVHVLKRCIISCVLSSLVINEFECLLAFYNINCMKKMQKSLLPIGTPNTLNPVMTSTGLPVCVE